MQTNKRQYFGTDGIRGRVGTLPITPEFMQKLGWAIGKVLGSKPGSKVLLGKDTRISGYLFESALETGLIAAGVNVHLLGPLSTPAIAYLTGELRAQAGIVISASHNPHYDNGIKIFTEQGFKIPDEIELSIENYLSEPLVMVSSEHLGKAYRVRDAVERYCEFCKSLLPENFSLKGLKIVIDCANGATYKIAPKLFSELGASVITVGNKPDGLNINQDCGSTCPALLQKTVLENNADLGIAFDGDGDRVIMVDANGELVDGDELLFVITRYCLAVGAMTGGVVGTLMTNYGLEMAYKRLGIPFLRARVGDRYVLELLQREKWQIGGESSGHLIHLGYTTTGDGVISALQILKAMQYFEKPLHELKQEIKKLPQTTVNVRLPVAVDPLSHDTVKAAISNAQAKLGETGRVLLRPSGTEPLLRVMVEGEEASLVNALALELANEVELAISNIQF